MVRKIEQSEINVHYSTIIQNENLQRLTAKEVHEIAFLMAVAAKRASETKGADQ